MGAAVIGTAANDTVDDNEEDVAEGTLDESLRSTAPEASDIYRGRRHGEGGLAVFQVLRGRPELRLCVQGSITASGPLFTLA